MADLSTGGGGSGAAYTYVQDSQPSNPEEGESWYDTGANAAYVYDGAAWIEQTVADHSELSGVGGSDHHGFGGYKEVSYSGNPDTGNSWQVVKTYDVPTDRDMVVNAAEATNNNSVGEIRIIVRDTNGFELRTLTATTNSGVNTMDTDQIKGKVGSVDVEVSADGTAQYNYSAYVYGLTVPTA